MECAKSVWIILFYTGESRKFRDMGIFTGHPLISVMGQFRTVQTQVKALRRQVAITRWLNFFKRN